MRDPEVTTYEALFEIPLWAELLMLMALIAAVTCGIVWIARRR